MKLSLRTQKLNSKNSSERSEHSDRTTNAKSVDTEKSENNFHYKSEHFQKSTEELWQHIQKDFKEKKAQNLIAKNRRFLKKNSTKTTKDENGKKSFEQVETSISREFIIQIGNEKDGFLDMKKSKELYEKIMKKITEKYKLSILQYDFHGDEKVPHLHFTATQYDFLTGEFSKEFQKINSYEKMQKDIFEFVQKELNIKLEGYEKKTCMEKDYIAPEVYRRNKSMLKKAKKFCKKKDELDKKITGLEKYQEVIRSLKKRSDGKVTKLEKKIEELESKKPEIEYVENPLNTDLKKQIQDRDLKISDLEKHEEVIRSLKKRSDGKVTKLEKKIEELESKEPEIVEVEVPVEVEKIKYKIVENPLNVELENELRKLKKAYDSKVSKLQEWKDWGDGRIKKVDELEQEIATLKKEITTLKEKKEIPIKPENREVRLADEKLSDEEKKLYGDFLEKGEEKEEQQYQQMR